MTTFAALLGNNPSLSMAELTAVLPDIQWKPTSYREFGLFSTSQALDQAFLNTLGGTLLLAQELSACGSIGDVPKLLKEALGVRKSKATFSIRAYGLKHDQVHALLRDCKNYLKDNKIPSRYVGNEHTPAKAIQLHDEGLISGKEGCEILILADDDGEKIWIGKTIAAHDVKAYTLRDIGKPVRDTQVGLLPPKLAQILLNFGTLLQRNTPVKSTYILDPFCGTGVIPIECIIRRIPLMGSDISMKAVNDCTKNLEWARKTYGVAKKDIASAVWRQDACKQFEVKEMPMCIVTEGTLGPALRGRPTDKQAEKLRKEVDAIIAGFLENAVKNFPSTPIVMTWPVWYSQSNRIHLKQAMETAQKLGFSFVLPNGVPSTLPGRPTLIYRRDDQFVGREIVLLLPNGKSSTPVSANPTMQMKKPIEKKVVAPKKAITTSVGKKPLPAKPTKRPSSKR